MKIKDTLIETATEALTASGIVDDNNTFNSEYKGYISSFGAAIIQSGLLPAIIFFENSSRGKSEKKKLVNAVVRILSEQSAFYSSSLSDGWFSKFIILHKDQKKKIEQDVNEAATALKLALRTFEEKK